MIYALDPQGIRIEPIRGARAFCPLCGEEVIAHCGEVLTWHWSHRSRVDCDPWWEGETDWHLGWKQHVPSDRAEVAFGEHRADILASDGTVIELQHSDISSVEIVARERFYRRMVWLIDGEPFKDQFRVELTDCGAKFAWMPPRKTWLASRKPKFVHGFSVGTFVNDINPFSRRVEPRWRPSYYSDEIFQILECRSRPSVRGTGRIIPKERFCERLLS